MPRKGEVPSLSEVEGLILEVGCGTGRHIPRFLKSGQSVHAVDFDFDAIHTARSLLAEGGITDRIFLAVANADSLPFIDQVFNEVHCIDVLHWASGKKQFEAMWMESWRVLQPAGTFFAMLHSASVDTKWFFAEDALIEILADRCEGEWMKRSESALVLRKKS